MNDYESSTELYRASALTAAKELGYPVSVRERIRKAASQIEISNILAAARHTS